MFYCDPAKSRVVFDRHGIAWLRAWAWAWSWAFQEEAWQAGCSRSRSWEELRFLFSSVPSLQLLAIFRGMLWTPTPFSCFISDLFVSNFMLVFGLWTMFCTNWSGIRVDYLSELHFLLESLVFWAGLLLWFLWIYM